jgi:CRISPR-associated protein (TIGR03984 family)
MTTLWYATPAAPVTLRDAVTGATPVLGAEAVGWLSSATAHQMVRLVDGVPHDPSGPADLTGVFSARLFSERAELRWLHTGAGLGDAVLLTEKSSPDGWREESAGEIGEVIEGRYALWGRRVEPHSSHGWARAVEGRIGWLDVPVAETIPDPPPKEQSWPTSYLALHYLEYVSHDGYGNARVFEERLRRIAAVSPTRGRTP